MPLPGAEVLMRRLKARCEEAGRQEGLTSDFSRSTGCGEKESLVRLLVGSRIPVHGTNETVTTLATWLSGHCGVTMALVRNGRGFSQYRG